MDPKQVETLVEDRLKAHQDTMLAAMNTMFTSMAKMSNETQLNKLSTIVAGVPVYKRKSNEQQYKLNTKVAAKINEADAYRDNNKIEDGRQKIAEGSYLINLTTLMNFLTNK